MKKLLILLLFVILLSACNEALCPAYSDSVNDVKNTLTQKGNYRADGINRVYRDAYHKKR
ncbi:MAG: lipoprotein [Bacteroidales bacterium]